MSIALNPCCCPWLTPVFVTYPAWVKQRVNVFLRLQLELQAGCDRPSCEHLPPSIDALLRLDEATGTTYRRWVVNDVDVVAEGTFSVATSGVETFSADRLTVSHTSGEQIVYELVENKLHKSETLSTCRACISLAMRNIWARRASDDYPLSAAEIRAEGDCADDCIPPATAPWLTGTIIDNVAVAQIWQTFEAEPACPGWYRSLQTFAYTLHPFDPSRLSPWPCLSAGGGDATRAMVQTGFRAWDNFKAGWQLALDSGRRYDEKIDSSDFDAGAFSVKGQTGNFSHCEFTNPCVKADEL